MKRFLIAICCLMAGCGTKSASIPVRIGALMNGLQAQQMPITLAQTLGYFKEEGLDVTLENLSSNSKTIQALVGGSVDVAGVGHTQPIQMAAEGQHIRSFFTGTRRNNIVILAAPVASKHIRGIEDMKGAKLGIPSPGSPTHLLAIFLLKKHGLSLDSVSNVSIGTGASAMAAVESGRVDVAAVSGGDHIRILRRMPEAKVIYDSGTTESMKEYLGGEHFASGFLAARQEWLNSHPEAARRLARASVRALGWIATHSPEQIREKLPESSKSSDVGADLEIIRVSVSSFTTDGKMIPGAPEAIKHYLDAVSDKVRDAKIDLSSTWTDEYLPGAS